MEEVVGLHMYLKKTQGTIMKMDGTIIRKERFDTDKENMRKFLKKLPPDTKVTLESQGFCWPWIQTASIMFRHL